jgi:hypothetical protein
MQPCNELLDITELFLHQTLALLDQMSYKKKNFSRIEEPALQGYTKKLLVVYGLLPLTEQDYYYP